MAFSGLALLPLAALYLYLAFSLLLAQSPEKNNGMLHQKPVNRLDHLETSLLKGNRTKKFSTPNFCTKTDG
ncbi:hypothetical protein BST90_16635 [Salmonella enterica subsp. enterica serovar Typhi]|nr:hypothetical protein BST90_16635 [Salmonella enterica subsp. enterica serovar Typhi]